MIHVLLVEDDPVIGHTLAMSLPYRGFHLKVATTIAEGRRLFGSEPFDLVLLDVQLPDGSGFDLCGWIREQNDWVPVLMVTARTDEPSAVQGLSGGADDYIRKPFGLDELTARMNRLIGRKASRKDHLHFRSIRLDLPERRAWIGEKEIPLGKREFDILTVLVRHSGEVVTREGILDAISDNPELFDRTIDSHLSHLRRKLKDAGGNDVHISPVYGVGYRLETAKKSS